VNCALDRYAENPIIDELVFWPPKSERILSVRACCVMFRKPFIEVKMAGGELFQRHFPRPGFAGYWAEACVILDALTSIELITDFSCEPYRDPARLVREVLAVRDECIADCDRMFAEGMYEQFLMQYGRDYRDLPAEAERKLEIARRELGIGC
jgi:hypothetical protein